MTNIRTGVTETQDCYDPLGILTCKPDGQPPEREHQDVWRCTLGDEGGVSLFTICHQTSTHIRAAHQN